MNQIFLTAGFFIISGSLILYFILMRFSEKKQETVMDGDFYNPSDDTHPDEELSLMDDDISWNLPEFQRENRSEKLAVTSGKSDIRNAGSNIFSPDEGTFDGKDYIGHSGGIHDLSKKFMDLLGAILKNKIIILYLMDGGGKLRAVLKRTGKINLSGEIIQESPGKDFIDLLVEKNFLLSDDEKTAYIPIMNSQGLSGAVKIYSEKHPISSVLIKETIAECVRFGKLLHQSRIYEQANTDYQSGFMNGLKFQSDLDHEFRMKDHLNSGRQLIIARTGKSFIPAAGRILTEVLSDEFQFYRIESGAIAILGPRMDGENFRDMKLRIENRMDANSPEIYLGQSILKKNMPSPAAWISDAEEDLKNNYNLPETRAKAMLN